MHEKVRAAIIGCGGIANGKHMPSVRQLGYVDMVAFCDIVPERAEKAARDYGTPDARVYTDYRKLLEDKTIDAVHVCTPNHAHALITVDALQAGKHVICEKPMAKTAAEAAEMVAAAKRSGKVLTIGYQSRYRADSQFLKQIVDDGELGEIYFAKAHAIRRRGVPTWGVFMDEEKQGGGPLIDIGTHALDLTLWLMNNYKPKYAVGTAYKKFRYQRLQGNPFGEWDPEKFTVEDSAFGFIVMEDGATIILESAWALNTLDVAEACCSLSGTKAGADCRGGVHVNKIVAGRQTVLTPDLGAGGVAFYEGQSADPSVAEQQTFYRAITEGTPLVVLPEQALVVSRILEAIYESARSGQPYFFETK